MNPPPQLLSPGMWTVHPPKGGAGLFAVALGAWGLGAVTPKPKVSEFIGDDIPF